jgi:hypothetical protein
LHSIGSGILGKIGGINVTFTDLHQFFEVRIMIANVPGVFAQDAQGECDASSDLNHLSDGY